MFYWDSVHRENCLTRGFLIVESWGATQVLCGSGIYILLVVRIGVQDSAFEFLTLLFAVSYNKGPIPMPCTCVAPQC